MSNKANLEPHTLSIPYTVKTDDMDKPFKPVNRMTFNVFEYQALKESEKYVDTHKRGMIYIDALFPMFDSDPKSDNFGTIQTVYKVNYHMNAYVEGASDMVLTRFYSKQAIEQVIEDMTYDPAD